MPDGIPVDENRAAVIMRAMSVIKSGISGWPGIIRDTFTFADVTIAARSRTTVFATILLVLSGVAALYGGETRYDDVIYLDGLNQPALHLKALRRTPVMFSRGLDSAIGYLAPHQTVEVLGVGEDQLLISGRVATGPVQGWVDARDLEAPPPELIARLRARAQQAQANRGLIERHEVAVGMTHSDVRASLGRPDRTAGIRTRQGDEEQWFYTTYRYLPYYTRDTDANGNPRQEVRYHREASGHKVITFHNDEVVEVTEQQDEQQARPGITVLPGRPVN